MKAMAFMIAAQRGTTTGSRERITDAERRKTTEIAVGCPKLTHPVLETNRGNAPVVNGRTRA